MKLGKAALPPLRAAPLAVHTAGVQASLAPSAGHPHALRNLQSHLLHPLFTEYLLLSRTTLGNDTYNPSELSIILTILKGKDHVRKLRSEQSGTPSSS